MGGTNGSEEAWDSYLPMEKLGTALLFSIKSFICNTNENVEIKMEFFYHVNYILHYFFQRRHNFTNKMKPKLKVQENYTKNTQMKRLRIMMRT